MSTSTITITTMMTTMTMNATTRTAACHHHHDDDDEDEHEHHHHHHHHHGHDADEVFISWGEETHKKFTKAEIERILKALEDADDLRHRPARQGLCGKRRG